MNSLRTFGIKWLRFEKRCDIVLTERSPRYLLGIPDVIGVSKSRHLLEIEIKCSVSDFKANEKKSFMSMRRDSTSKHNGILPRQFWFLVTPKILDRVAPLVPEWAGLMVGPRDDEVQCLRVIKCAPVNKESRKLTFNECVRLVHLQSNELVSVREQLNAAWKHEGSDDWWTDAVNFSI